MKQIKPIYKVRHINNLKEMINDGSKMYANNPAFKIKNTYGTYDIVTHKMFKNDIDFLGTALISLGLKDKKIAIISENRYEWCVAYLATVNGTGIAVPLDRALPEEEIRNLLMRSESSCVIFSSKYIDIMKEVKERNPFVKSFICMDSINNNEFLEFKTVLSTGKKLIESGDKSFIDAIVSNETMNIILFTSGTTAASKAVMLSHKNICSNIMSTCMFVKIKQDDIALSFLPIHHTYECTLGFLTMIYNGASIVHCDGLRYIMQNLKESHATVMVCVPLLFENMHKKIIDTATKTGKLDTLYKGMKISNFLRKYFRINITRTLFKSIYENFGGKMRLFICGAAAVDPDVCKDFNALGITFLQGYGLTETSPLLTGNTPRDIVFNSPGKSIPNVDVKIDNPNEDGIGEIIAKGPNIMLGYYNNIEATNEVLKDGWFYTGDLGYETQNGDLVITGRKKNVIVLKNGKNVFPEELEGLLNKEEFIKESLIWGEETKDGDTIIAAKIIPNLDRLKERFGNLPDIQLKEKFKEIIININHKLPSYKAIKDWKLSAEELIKTTTQKVKRFEELKKLKNK